MPASHGPAGSAPVSLREKLFWILAYSACSSTMLVINKLAVQELPLPTVVSGAQLLASSLVVVAMKIVWPTVMGAMDKTKVIPFALYTAMFAAGLFANMKALMLTNVGAVIAARSCLPVIVCLIEWAFMGRALPGARSCLSLAGVVAFAGLYIRNDSAVDVEGLEGYAWLLTWWLLLALQMTYGKWMTEKIEMTQWERVFYTNAFAIPPTISFASSATKPVRVLALPVPVVAHHRGEIACGLPAEHVLGVGRICVDLLNVARATINNLVRDRGADGV